MWQGLTSLLGYTERHAHPPIHGFVHRRPTDRRHGAGPPCPSAQPRGEELGAQRDRRGCLRTHGPDSRLFVCWRHLPLRSAPRSHRPGNQRHRHSMAARRSTARGGPAPDPRRLSRLSRRAPRLLHKPDPRPGESLGGSCFFGKTAEEDLDGIRCRGEDWPARGPGAS